MLDERYEVGPNERAMLARTPTVGTLIGLEARAEVNHGRLIARCPDAYCSGAEYVTRGRPVFWCDECQNRPAGGAYISVEFPTDADLERASSILSVRPLAAQNWRPWVETLDQLEMENTAHGLDRGIVNRHEVIH